jgi:hypothetical protein
MTDRRAFFFPHPLNPNGQPGRVPFRVDANLLTPAGPVEPSSVVVCADGFGQRVLGPGQQNCVGSNQDPCVFARPLSIIHSFCRIDGMPHNEVRCRGESRTTSLAQEVCKGDLILYGKYDPPSKSRIKAQGVKSVFIDTVIVVDRVVTWPTARNGNVWELLDPLAFARHLTGIHNVAETDVWRYNLADALPGGNHHNTRHSDHRVIIGRATLDSSHLTNHETSFVPLADRKRQTGEWFPLHLTIPPDLDLPIANHLPWRRLVDFVNAMAGNHHDAGYITEFEDLELAFDICDAVIALSGRGQGCPNTVAIPPLIPMPLPPRSGHHSC